MPRVLRSSIAETDLLDIWLFIAADNPGAADRTLDRIDDACAQLARSPRIGIARPELGANVRSFPVGRYIIFYRPVPRGIEIIRVLSGYRDITGLL
jgi:toxin ParE1/3/4